MSLKKIVTQVHKAKKESVMGKLANGDDPMEPWSKRHNAPIEESEQLDEVNTQVLFKYIKALGYDPEHMDFATRSKFARSNAFKNFKATHQNDHQTAMSQVDLKKEESVNEVSDTTLKSYTQKAMRDTMMGKKDRNAGMSKAYSRLSGTNKPLLKTEQEELDEAGTGLLMSFIKSKGLDPTSMDGNMKSNYSRSSEFQKFKHAHRMKAETSGMGERGDDWNEEKKQVKEAVDRKDTVTMNIPLLIRLVEWSREDAKSDMDLHKMIENVIQMRNRGVLTMDHYEQIVKIGLQNRYRKLKEEEQLDELKKQDDNQELDSHITREEKKMKSADPCWKGYQMVGTKKKGGKEVPNCVPEEVVTEGIGGIMDSPLSATNSVKAMESRKKEMSKSARMIKSIYKKKNVKETLYDWEKDDKAAAKPMAKIVVQGGKTMTGQPRDTIEIDPVLRNRPNRP